MKSSKKKRSPSPALQEKLASLEEKVLARGIQVHYDLMEAAGLKLKDGICRIRGEYHLFIDKRKSAPDKIEILQDYIDHPLPEDIPEHMAEDAPQGSNGDDSLNEQKWLPDEQITQDRDPK